MSVASTQAAQGMALDKSNEIIAGNNKAMPGSPYSKLDTGVINMATVGGFAPVMLSRSRSATMKAGQTQFMGQAVNYMNEWRNSDMKDSNPFNDALNGQGFTPYLPGSYVTADGGTYINKYNPLVSAGDKLGAVSRAQYNEWVNNFQPAEGDLLSMTSYDGNEGVANKLIAEGTNRVDANFRGAEGQQNRNLARYGMAMDASEQEAFNREADINKGAALVDMTNKANRWQEDLNKTVMATGVSTSGLKKV